ncbi:MAG TPA: hypothetical protein VI792_11745, partial [Candidatus Eisenbacteria bacterium]
LAILRLAGLVEDRRDGRWIEYRLARTSSNPHARRILALLQGDLDRDGAIVADRKRLREIRAIPPAELCALPAAALHRLRRPARRRPGRDRAHV